MEAVTRQLRPAIVMLAVFTVITGLLYPLVITGIGQTVFHDKANGSLIKVDGKAVGSRWIGQTFTKPEYFHPRPSVAGNGYDPRTSSGSNKGPTNPDFLKEVKARVAAYRKENQLGAHADVPVDAVTASGSGLDPEISVLNAQIQARRVASVRGVPIADVLRLVDRYTDGRGLGFLGEKGVNVLELNVALDRMQK